MDYSLENLEKDVDNYNANIKMVTMVIVIMVIILTLIYFVRIYASKKEEVIKDMKTEASIIETVISDHLNYSQYFIHKLTETISARHEDLHFIEEKLKDHFASQDFNMLFGWRKYSWVNSDYVEVVSNTKGILEKPKKILFIEDIVKNIQKDNQANWKENIRFYASKTNEKGDSLKIIDSIMDDKNNKYLGSVILSYDIGTMIRSLNNRLRNNNINYIIIDNKLNIVAQSKHLIKSITTPYTDSFAIHLKQALEYNNFNMADYRSELNDVYFLDMINGVNYLIKKLKHLPFIVIVNIDNNLIKKNILDSVTKKFIEVSVFAVLCLAMVVTIYKRETILRARSEKATKIATDATRAKTTFLAFTSHEVRSPLGFILTGSEIMTKELLGRLPPSYMKYAEGIYQNANIILDFITDILDENQIIEGKFKIVNSISDVRNIVEEAVKVNIARYNSRNVKLATDYNDNLPLLVCDKRRMLQVLSNLISNSIKYSDDPAIIKVEVKMIDSEMMISVSDQGIGMNQSEISAILTSSGAFQNSHGHSVGSYGLGFPIVKMLLDAHEAKLSIVSEPKKGTIVKIVLPKYKLVYQGINYAKNENQF